MPNRDEQIIELLEKLKKQLIDLHDFPCNGFSCELIDKIDALLKEQPCKTCGGNGYKAPKGIDVIHTRKETLQRCYPCPDCQEKKGGKRDGM